MNLPTVTREGYPGEFRVLFALTLAVAGAGSAVAQRVPGTNTRGLAVVAVALSLSAALLLAVPALRVVARRVRMRAEWARQRDAITRTLGGETRVAILSIRGAALDYATRHGMTWARYLRPEVTHVALYATAPTSALIGVFAIAAAHRGDIFTAIRLGEGGWAGHNREDEMVERTFEAATTVRRLTPVECERLQGFPDDWTITSNGKPQADSPRYKQMGNAVAVPVLTWVARRIAAHTTTGATP